jgi:hypothetical protein
MKSLDDSPGTDGFQELSYEDAGHAGLSVERMVEIQLEQEKLDRLMRTLPQREEQVLRIRYGFHDGVARSLQETGSTSGSRVSASVRSRDVRWPSFASPSSSPTATIATARPSTDPRTPGVPAMRLEDYIREIPDFPKKGILFKDIMPSWHRPRRSVPRFQRLAATVAKPDAVVGIESRGFVFSASNT